MKKKNIFTSFFTGKSKARTISLLLAIVAYVVFQILSSSGNLPRLYTALLVPVCAYMVAAIGLNVNVGLSGELNLGQAGFMSVGAFGAVIISGMLETAVPNEILRLAICIIAGAILAAIVGLVISFPVLKLQGDYLAIVTLAFGQIIMSLINNLYVGYDSTGLHFAFIDNNIALEAGGKMLISGPMGATGVTTISTFTGGFVLILIALLVVYNLMDSRNGRAIMAARDNRIAAESVGISITKTKTLAFVLSAALGGAAGALYGLNYSSFAASKFDFNNSILLLVYVVLGGLGNMTGTMIATSLLVVLPEALRSLSRYRMLIYAIVLIGIMLVTNNETVKEFFKEKFHKKSKEGVSDND